MKKSEYMKQKVFICDCNHSEHQFVVTYFLDDPLELDVVYIGVRLNSTYGFFNRCWEAIKYVFKVADGEYCETLLQMDEVSELNEMLVDAMNEHKNSQHNGSNKQPKLI